MYSATQYIYFAKTFFIFKMSYFSQYTPNCNYIYAQEIYRIPYYCFHKLESILRYFVR
jgi:hypothetical protein